MNDRPTPETDRHAEYKYGRVDRLLCEVEFTRTLERQRDDLVNALQQIATYPACDPYFAIEAVQEIAEKAIAEQEGGGK